jgi:hypothetical protein
MEADQYKEQSQLIATFPTPLDVAKELLSPLPDGAKAMPGMSFQLKRKAEPEQMQMVITVSQPADSRAKTEEFLVYLKWVPQGSQRAEFVTGPASKTEFKQVVLDLPAGWQTTYIGKRWKCAKGKAMKKWTTTECP